MELSTTSAGTLRALRRLVRALRLADRAAESRLGLSAAQLFVLERLSEGPVGSMAELAGRTLTDASSVSVVVQRLAERGLVVRAVAPDDARRTTLRLSASGKRLLGTAPRSPQADLLDALEQLSSAERKNLESLLERVVRSMGIDETTPTPMFFESEPRVTRSRRRARPTGTRARSRG
jgi:MarR family transcriptional regulator, organic hydroperoxide resistance regulator